MTVLPDNDQMVRVRAAEDVALVGVSPPQNAGDEAQVDASSLLQELRVARSQTAMIKTLATREGRHVLYQIIDLCGLNLGQADMSGGELAMLAGMRNVGLRVIAAIEAVDPKGWVQMQLEHKDQELQDWAIADQKRKQLAAQRAETTAGRV